MATTTEQTAPERSYQQRLDALEIANGIRTYRMRLKADLKRGDRDARALLLAPPAEILTMKVFDLLLAVPKYGRVKVNQILKRCAVSPSKTIGGLSDRQRVELGRELA